MMSSGKFNPKEDGTFLPFLCLRQTYTALRDMPPDHIEDLFDDLESNTPEGNSSLFKRLSTVDAGYLAEFIRKKIEQDRETANQEIEAELSVRRSALPSG